MPPRGLFALAILFAACTPQRALDASSQADAPADEAGDEAAAASAGGGALEAAAPVGTARGPAGITALAAGVHHACALRGGEVHCWGQNRGGILGVGAPDLAGIARPRRVPGLDRVVDLAADYDYTCAVTDAHQVYCWGENDRGQLATGDLDPRAAPALIADLTAERVIAGYGRSCAAVGRGYRCWGSGELGDGEKRSRQLAPLVIPALSAIDDLVLGDGHACVREDGEVRCWGANSSGQLGNGEGGCRYERALCPTSRCLPPQECKHSPLPVLMVGLPPIVEVAVGGSFTYARDASGRIWSAGQQGHTMDFSAENPRYRPRLLEGLPAMAEVDAGSGHACARTAAGELWCWGNNAFGQLGHAPGPRGGGEPAARVDGLAPVRALAVGFHFTCALTGIGEEAEVQAWCWGDNGRSQLGDGTDERRHAPVAVRWE